LGCFSASPSILRPS